MRTIAASVVAIVVLASAAVAAERSRQDWPKPNAIERAAERIEYHNDRKVQARYRGRLATFVPCDISDLSDEQREKGMILGKLVTEGPSADKLPAGTYLVYVRKHNDQWESYFCEKLEPVAKSTETKWQSDNDHNPSFQIDNTTIRYWRLRIAW